MRRDALPWLLFLLLLAPTIATAQPAFDPAAEARDGAWIHVYLDYEGGSSG